MRVVGALAGRVRRPPLALGLLGLAALATLALAGLAGLGGASRAVAQAGAGEPTAQTDDSIPASHVTMIGTSPAEAPDETWGVGQGEEGVGVLVRYVTGSGWSLGPSLVDATGQSLSGFKLDAPGPNGPSPLAGQMTASGSGVLVGTVPAAGGSPAATRQVVLVRNPGGSFKETDPVASEGEAALLKPGFELFAQSNRAPLLAPLDESSGSAGALLVPISTKGEPEDEVLHWANGKWTGEPIEVPSSSATEFHVVGIGASSPANAWLLAELSSGEYALFRRLLHGGEPTWAPVAPGPGLEQGAGLTVPDGGGKAPFTVPNAPSVARQVLTVTKDGVWIDGERTDAHASTTMFFKPQGGSESEEVGSEGVTSWCPDPSSDPACDHELPEALPAGASRSIAWANSGTPFGERVITGLANGASLRLDGSEFTRVLALGASAAPSDVGATFGAAFSSPREGWLGQAGLPVHLTLEPVSSRLAPWPVSFRKTLVAIAPQPGAPVGSLSSEALAVGDRGEVARYKPGKGWLPESLLSASGRRATPVLRSVAWPTPSNAYAVGDEGQMWLWRSETGLWEQDPATPFNFRGNLLGVAFDPNEPNRGYAVGESGVLLGYGKSWTQEPLPPQVAGASFTSIAFAGSEAIVAYRQLPDPSRNRYTGGLLVNDGSGWRIDESAAAAAGQDVPEVVAGLPNDSAAFAASGADAAQVFERSGSGGSWQPTPVPLPGGREPGSLALFEEGGALRVIASGSALNTFAVESVSPAPPGSPPNLIEPYPLEASAESGVLRQTSSGWNDEEHELNNAQEPPGHYKLWDMPYQPDPVSAVLIDPSGTHGWAVGGFVDNEHGGALDTADIDRYPADGVTPPGVSASPIPTNAAVATFAIGGGAQCAAPCADRANARIGPDVWLSAALARAGTIPGVRAFLYTGPHVTTGETEGPATVAIPYGRELGHYASLLAASPLPTYPAPSPTDLSPGAGESSFEQVFSGFPTPFGDGSASAGMAPAGGAREEECVSGPGCQAYYAMDSTGPAGTVRVIVLDNTGDVGQAQREWLASELEQAKGRGEPAIVVGDANLNTQIAAGDPFAIAVAQIMQADGASAYFFDAPEENIKRPLIGAPQVQTFGSGTLGYVSFLKEGTGDFLGASGFLLGQVNFASLKEGNRAEVTARLIPNVGELALEGKAGTLLRRSQVAEFQALARRPRAGNRSRNGADSAETDPYIPIPSNCVGTLCANGLFPEYTFSSSRPDIGNFVAPNLASPTQPAVLLDSHNKPIPDPQSGLFCAYNAGTTIVTISTGGLSSSLPVTVQAGSVRQPCGTTPLSELAAQQSAPVAPPSPAPPPTPAGPPPTSASPPIVPVPPAPAATPTAIAHPVAPHAPFFVAPVIGSAVPAIVPPPVPTPARPTPPSGTSAVTSPVEAAEKEEEQEEATEQVSNQAVAYHSSEHEPTSAYILGIIVLAAFAGASVGRRSRRGRRDVRVAPATISATRAQRRSRPDRRRPWS